VAVNHVVVSSSLTDGAPHFQGPAGGPVNVYKNILEYAPRGDWKPVFVKYLRVHANIEGADKDHSYVKSLQIGINKIGKAPWRITPEDVYTHKDEMIRQRKSKSHINQILLAFNHWFAMLGVPVKCKTLHRDRTLPDYLEIEETRALLDAVDGSFTLSMVPAECHKALVASILYGALRPKEGRFLTVDDFDPRNRTLELRQTKTKVDDTVILKEKCVRIILAWLEIHPTRSGWMFPVKPCKQNAHKLRDENGYVQPSRRQIRRIVKHYAAKAGIKRRVWTYMLRHTLATSLAFKGCNAFYIQQQMRHKDLRTTLLYVHINKEKQRKAMDEFVPEF